DIAFLQSDLTPDHLVTGGGVALELDAAHIKLLAFVDVNVEKDQFFFVVKPGVGYRSEVDVAQLAVGLAQGLQALAYFLLAEDLSILDRKECSQGLHVLYRFVVLERDSAQRVALALLDGHGNVHGLTWAALQQWNTGAPVS